MAEKIKDRVLQILGDDSTYDDSISIMNQICDDAIWETATALPPRLLMSVATQPTDPMGTGGNAATGDTETIDDTLVLQVYRVERTGAPNIESSYIRRLCEPISLEESIKATDSNSIHYATKESPVYWITSVGSSSTLKVFPNATGISAQETELPLGDACTEIWKYDRQDDFEWESDDDFDFIPEEAEEVIIHRIALKILDHKIADAGTQEEDQEMVTILSATRQLLEKNTLDLMNQLKVRWENKV
tara:strand:+ start:4737 stop:5474 length:738 start_codon:yes stop_codon:yes gene_type:complete